MVLKLNPKQLQNSAVPVFFAAFLIFVLGYFAFGLPVIEYVLPTPSNNSATNLNWTYINLTSTEDLNQSFLEWSNASGLANVTMSNSSMTNWFVNMTNLTEGAYNYSIWAENTTSDWNLSAMMFITVDMTRPDIRVQSPENITYFGKTIDLNVSANEPIDTWRYSINGTGNVTFSPNTTITVSAGFNNITVYGNDTAGNINSSAVYFTLNTTLEANLSEPDINSPTGYIQNTTFLVNATVFCRQGGCGNVAGTLLYNGTSANPDTPVSTIAGSEPFFINESSPASTKSCGGSPLSEGDFCNLTWAINATDSTLSSWKLAVNFSSDSGWTNPNTTPSAVVLIDTCFVDITAQWTSIDFQNPLVPNTYENAALGNDNMLYNITVREGSCNTDLYIKGTNMKNETFGYALGVGNLTWSNASNTYSSSFNMTAAYKLLKYGVPQLTNVTTWYWINVPPVYAASYNGTVFIQGVKSGSAPP